MNVVVHTTRNQTNTVKVEPIIGDTTDWIDLSPLITEKTLQDRWTDGIAGVRFYFRPADRFRDGGVRAAFTFARQAGGGEKYRTVEEHDSADLIGFRIPADHERRAAWLLSIREDTQRRLDQVKGFNLPDVATPKRFWTMTGVLANGQYYTDPAIADMDMEIFERLGINGLWERGGGQHGNLRPIAARHGINRTTFYWRAVAGPPRDDEVGGARLDWNALAAWVDRAYRNAPKREHARHPHGVPEFIVDLMDEPAGTPFAGPEYQQAFRAYLQQQGLTPSFFGKAAWDDLETPRFNWRGYFKLREDADLDTPQQRRLWYWALRFWNHANARLYAMATRKVEEVAPTTGTRVNFGPPWWYDYGHLPRGIDAYEFGKLRSVSLSFNEDWIGSGDPRWPYEINTYLVDFSRAALRTQAGKLGGFVTRDSDRWSVKLRSLAMIAREGTFIDYYHYGPAYCYFDHWSDNASMVRGVGEITRDIADVEDIILESKMPQPQVAILYSRSWPAWKRNDTEQVELMMTHLALLHAGLPVDLVWDEEVADGRFAARGYKALYVVNESVMGAAADEVARWVHGGGHLWTTGWGAMRNEYDTESDAWNEMLGITGRSWKPVGDLARYDEPVGAADGRRPYFSRRSELEFAADAGAAPVDAITGPDGMKPMRRTYGAGVVQITPWTAGVAYCRGAQKTEGMPFGTAILYPDDDRRGAIAQFALESGATPPAMAGASQVLAWPLWSQHRGIVMIANFTGEPAGKIDVNFRAPFPVASVRSQKQGAIAFEQDGEWGVALALDVADVTDILVISEANTPPSHAKAMGGP